MIRSNNQPQRFVSHPQPTWAPGAWLATGGANSNESAFNENAPNEIVIQHGSAVSVHEHWFGEIVWDGPFEELGFDRTDIVYGSGGKLIADGVVFVSSANTLDRLQHHRAGDRWTVSNSLVCLLTQLQAELASLYRYYRRDFGTIIAGLDQYQRTLQTTRGEVRLVYHDNLLWRDGQLTTLPKPVPSRDLSTYANYRDFLESALVRCADNMRSPQRKQSYEFLGTISTGFDSPTVAALARKAGLQEVLTFGVAREGLDDDGSAIADKLGLSITMLDRNLWQQQTVPGLRPETQFLACDAKGEDVYFSGAEPLLERRVLLTGYAAGPWTAAGRANPNLRRADQSGLSLSEYRLWANFIHLPVPTMGVQGASQADLDSRAAELAPWTSGKSYDKPFSRRVLVEAGVPDELFGQEKKAASVLAFDRRSLLSAESKQDFLAHLAAIRRTHPLLGLKMRLRDISLLAMAKAARALQIFCRLAGPILPSKKIKRLATSGRLDEYVHFEPRCDYLFPWAMHHAQQRYLVEASNCSDKPNETETATM